MFVRSLVVALAATSLSLAAVPVLASETFSALDRAVDSENWSLAIALVDRLIVEHGSSDELLRYRTLLTSLNSGSPNIASENVKSLEEAVAAENWPLAIMLVDRLIVERGASDELLAYRSRLADLNTKTVLARVSSPQQVSLTQTTEAIDSDREREAFFAAREARLAAREARRERRNEERLLRAEVDYWRDRRLRRGTRLLYTPLLTGRRTYLYRRYR